MNQQVILHDGVLVCGALAWARDCICLRPPGHWGPHVVKMAEKYLLMQTTLLPIQFEITEFVAEATKNDKNWTWAE